MPSVLPLVVRVSRPYYYLVTLWLYLMPTGGDYAVFLSYRFWLGAAYCTLPLNILCYLMNDLADVATDFDNPRKGGSLLGAKESLATLQSLVPYAIAAQLPFLVAFAILIGPLTTILWFGAVFLVNWLYNFGPQLSTNYAPLDLVCPCGYLLVIPLSCWLSAAPPLPLRSWAHAITLVLRTQLWIQTFDVEGDKAAGRRNTAVRLGLRNSQALLALFLLNENMLVYGAFKNWPLQSFSTISLLMLAAQVALAPSTGAARGGSGGGGRNKATKPALSPSNIQATFVILGLGGAGLMGRVWLDAAFVA